MKLEIRAALPDLRVFTADPHGRHVLVVDATVPQRPTLIARFEAPEAQAQAHAELFVNAYDRVTLLEAELKKSDDAYRGAVKAGAEMLEQLNNLRSGQAALVATNIEQRIEIEALKGELDPE